MLALCPLASSGWLRTDVCFGYRFQRSISCGISNWFGLWKNAKVWYLSYHRSVWAKFHLTWVSTSKISLALGGANQLGVGLGFSQTLKRTKSIQGCQWTGKSSLKVFELRWVTGTCMLKVWVSRSVKGIIERKRWLMFCSIWVRLVHEVSSNTKS